jgi:glycosyltransferase involved in cell wall biosynthesis
VARGFLELLFRQKLGLRSALLARSLSLVLFGVIIAIGVLAALVLLAIEIAAVAIAAAFLPLVLAVKKLWPGLVITPLVIDTLYGRRKPKLAAVRRQFETVARGVSASIDSFRFTFAVNATFLGYVARHDHHADFIYCHDLYCLQAAVLLKLRGGCRIAYDSHEYYPYLHRYRIFQQLTKLYEGVLVRFVDTYITVSPPLARELETTYVRPGIIAIPNVEPRPAKDFVFQDGELSTLAAGRLKLLYQGHFAEQRGLEEVLQEWRRVNGVRAVLFLRGPRNEWRDRLERVAGEHGLLGKSVFFLAPVLERDLIAAAGEADLGLIPYKDASLAYRFACPNKLSQYLHAGLGIVANAIPFVQAMIEENGIGLCYRSEEPGSLAQAIDRLAADRAEVERIRSNASITARDRYCWENYEGILLRSLETAP